MAEKKREIRSKEEGQKYFGWNKGDIKIMPLKEALKKKGQKRK